MRHGIIYLLTNKTTNEKYVGQTTRDMKERLSDHVTEKRNRHVSNAIRKYGLDSFKVDELCSCKNQHDLNEMEKYFVEHFRTLYPNGYNHRAGGNQNGICSTELRKKISEAKMGVPNLKRRGEIRTQEQRLKISKGLGGKRIIAENLDTKEIKIYNTAHETRNDGHNPSNVVSICKQRRTHSKRWTFKYIVEQTNQSGSLSGKIEKHAQRLEIEPAIAE